MARKTGKPLRALIEEGLRRLFADDTAPTSYRLPDHSVGQRGATNPLEQLSSQKLREEVYGIGR